MKEYPLYPELPEEGKEEAQRLIDKFKEHVKKDIENLLGDLYVDVACHIESDSWTNYRNAIIDGFRNYNNRKVQAPYDFKKIREEIYKEYREDIVKDLNQDILEENERLKEAVKLWEDRYHDLHNRF